MDAPERIVHVMELVRWWVGTDVTRGAALQRRQPLLGGGITVASISDFQRAGRETPRALRDWLRGTLRAWTAKGKKTYLLVFPVTRQWCL